MGDQQIIWQGASLTGDVFYRVIREQTNIWGLLAAPIGTQATLAFKPVTSLPMCIDALATLGTQYSGLMFGAVPDTSLANRSIARTAANGVPIDGNGMGITAGGDSAAVRRARRRVSVQRSTATANT